MLTTILPQLGKRVEEDVTASQPKCSFERLSYTVRGLLRRAVHSARLSCSLTMYNGWALNLETILIDAKATNFMFIAAYLPVDVTASHPLV